MESSKPHPSFWGSMNRLICKLVAIGLCFAFNALLAGPAAGQHCTDSAIPGTLIGFTPKTDPDPTPLPNACNLLPCHKPKKDGDVVYEVTPPGCDGDEQACGIRIRVPLEIPGNSQMPTNTHARVFWFGKAKPDPPEPQVCLPGPPPFGNCAPISLCGGLGSEILVDFGETWIQAGPTCQDIAKEAGQENSRFRTYSVSAYACLTSTGECTQRLDIPDLKLDPETLWSKLQCDGPPPRNCDNCMSCPVGGTSVGTGPPEVAPMGLGPVPLRYKGRAAGHPGFPGTASWNLSLGRYWAHEFAERIVPDPDDTHVWLVTRFAAFHEFEDLIGGVYQKVSPSNEYRKLHRTAAGWELHDQDGTVQHFDNSGLWIRTQDRNGNAVVASYTGSVLGSVHFPDGRSAAFTYRPDGRLASVTEVGVGGTASRTWSYTWSGLDLVRIDRPDGTAWSFLYDDSRHPGSMTRMTLVGTGGEERIERAWEYDHRSNVIRTWKGAATFDGAGAVDKYSFNFDNPFRPTLTEVTDPLGNVTTYEIDRDPSGVKARVTQISGDCSTCGVGPNTRQFYDDPANPMRVTRSIDARGTVTLFGYDQNGQMISRTEAFMTDLERTTNWEYDEVYPHLVTAIERPSISGSGVRRASWVYDATGNATTRTEAGVENGSAFSYQTATTYNSAGRPVSVDPPDYGVEDRAVFGYDPNRGNLVVTSRSDPLVGATSFEYDPFNRRTLATDSNAVATETSYDALDRVMAVIQKGASAAEDLVTTNAYNEFGDLFRTVSPEGNVVEYGYDPAGRLISVERKSDAVTPGERLLYTLDEVGNRIREDRQRWDASGWVTESFTGFEYSTRCHLDKILHADGTVTEYSYDCEGNLEQVWDANHPSELQTRPPTQLYAYDELDRLRTVTQPWAGSGGGQAVTTYGYDVQDHLVRMTDANATVTSYAYSDRDLLTEEVSEVSGRTTFRYNGHGKLIEQEDAAGVKVSRQLDALDRVRQVDYPGDALDVVFRYDEVAVPFSKGRLTAVEGAGTVWTYRYDRFGRLTRDGALTFSYDRNGNRQTVEYPGGITARYGYDFANRASTLALEGAGAVSGPLVTAAEYMPLGPLSRLRLGNGLTESRDFDARYFPERITVGELFDWVYTTDAVGNIAGITDVRDPAGSRAYAYQDVQYFLTRGDGPWGTLSWSYDKVGNRLRETHLGATAEYGYAPNAAGGNSPRLMTVTGPGGDVTRYFYDLIGDLTVVAGEGGKSRHSYDAARRLSQISHDTAGEPPEVADLLYDGRSFLERATWRRFAAPEPGAEIAATYSSDGRLYHRSRVERPDPAHRRETPVTTENVAMVYFAGRAVAQVTGRVGEGEAVTYLTTDHLGTPVLAMNATGTEMWSGGFEPFGEDWSGSLAAGVFLRFPGQWASEWTQDLYYNVYRWYQPGRGRYINPDPLFEILLDVGLPHVAGGRVDDYAYSRQNPLRLIDALGLEATIGPGPSDPCSFYDGICQKIGCKYPCTAGAKYCRSQGSILNIFDSTETKICIRECLIDQYAFASFGTPLASPGCDSCDTCENDPRCISKSCLARQHKYCFRRCDSNSWWPGVFPSGFFFPTDGC